ncbi:hypothetical protein J4440_04945 [Candidatus Woesearchaeota archaeon]|nr:hypothetical protein [Candidatus Woesearchaeota archaeon]
MKLRYIIIPILIIFILLTSIFLYRIFTIKLDKDKVFDKTRSYSQALDLKLIPINEINNKNLTGQYNIEAYVIEKHICYCPPGAFCSRCIPNGILISEEYYNFKGTRNFTNSLEIQTTNPNQFEIEKKYLLSIEIIENKAYGKIVRLLGYDSI